jgi:hypothetical protein
MSHPKHYRLVTPPELAPKRGVLEYMGGSIILPIEVIRELEDLQHYHAILTEMECSVLRLIGTGNDSVYTAVEKLINANRRLSEQLTLLGGN